MAYNYLQIVGDCFPASEVIVATGKNPEIYTDLTWITTPIDQATLEASNCASSTATVNSLGDPISGDTVVWNGTDWENRSFNDGNPVLHIAFKNEAVTKNRWLEYSNSNASSNEIPFVAPYNVRLIAITFANGSDNKDTDVQIYRAAKDQGSTSTLAHTWAVRGARVAGKTVFNPILTFAAGEKVGVYLQDAGTSDPISPMIVLYFQKIDTISTDFTETFSGNL